MKRIIERRSWLVWAVAICAIAPSVALTEDQAKGSVSDASAPSVVVLEAQLAGSPAERDAAIQYIARHADAVPPIDYIYAVKRLNERGDNAQAAFWYYVWRIRMAAWNLAAPAKYGELTNAISSSMGEVINQWAGSDPEAMRAMMARASTFERRAPLFSGQPDGVSQVDWRRFVEASRTAHDASALDKVFSAPGAKDDMIANRRRNGLYVGPWTSPGAPLPGEWR